MGRFTVSSFAPRSPVRVFAERYAWPVRARTGHRRARVLIALMWGAGALIGCHPEPTEAPAEPKNMAWVAGADSGSDEKTKSPKTTAATI